MSSKLLMRRRAARLLVEVPVDCGGVPVVGGLVGQQEAPHRVRVWPIHIHLHSPVTNMSRHSRAGLACASPHCVSACFASIHTGGATLENSGKVAL
jgi:hypothetical protein